MSGEKLLSEEEYEEFYKIYIDSLNFSLQTAEKLRELKVHKQHVNRILEPYQYVKVLMTGNLSQWEYFVELREDKSAQPEIQTLARFVINAINKSVPKNREIHLPFYDPDKDGKIDEDVLKICAARCARLSYLSNNKEIKPDREKDLDLANRLVQNKHWSPFEHVAISKQPGHRVDTRNLRDWVPFRVFLESR